MSSIHNSKAPSRSSSNPAKAPPQSKKILIQQAPSLGSPGSSLATAGGTATINHPVQRPSPRAGSASPRPSRESSSQRMRHFRESRSPQGERKNKKALMLALLRAGRNLARLVQIGLILARHDALFMLDRVAVLLPLLTVLRLLRSRDPVLEAARPGLRLA